MERDTNTRKICKKLLRNDPQKFIEQCGDYKPNFSDKLLLNYLNRAKKFSMKSKLKKILTNREAYAIRLEDAKKRLSSLKSDDEQIQEVFNTIMSTAQSFRTINFEAEFNNGHRNKPQNLINILESPLTQQTFSQIETMIKNFETEAKTFLKLYENEESQEMKEIILQVEELLEKVPNYRVALSSDIENFKNIGNSAKATKKRFIMEETRAKVLPILNSGILKNLTDPMTKKYISILSSSSNSDNLEVVKKYELLLQAEQAKQRLLSILNSGTLEALQDSKTQENIFYLRAYPNAKYRNIIKRYYSKLEALQEQKNLKTLREAAKTANLSSAEDVIARFQTPTTSKSTEELLAEIEALGNYGKALEKELGGKSASSSRPSSRSSLPSSRPSPPPSASQPNQGVVARLKRLFEPKNRSQKSAKTTSQKSAKIGGGKTRKQRKY